jgi:hypothetical protein
MAQPEDAANRLNSESMNPKPANANLYVGMRTTVPPCSISRAVGVEPEPQLKHRRFLL